MSAAEKYEQQLRKTYEVPQAGPLLDILFVPRQKKAPARPARGESPAVKDQVWGTPPGRAGLDRPRKSAPPPPAPALPGGPGPDMTRVITNLKRILNRYHAYPLERTNLVVKSVCLDALLVEAGKLRGSQRVDEGALAVFLEHVEKRRDFLDKLSVYAFVDFLRIDRVVQIVRDKQERVMPAQPGKHLTVGLHWTRVMEKLDPYHRARPGGQDILDKFNSWAASNWNDQLRPSRNLVNFFLSDTYTTRHDQGVVYFDKVMRRFSKLVFMPSKRKVYAYYVRKVDKQKVEYDRCTVEDMKKGLIPHQKPFHTIGGSIVADNENIRYGDLARRKEGVDLFGAQIYVMHNDVFHTYKAQGAKHSMGLAGEAVQSAGMIVAEAGKILAIDNKSGHYRPSWKHLQQAVDVLHRNQVFHQEACVGISHGEGCVFLTLADYRDLASKNFPMQATLDAINRGHEHVFQRQKFQRIRKAYEASDIGGNRLWSWEAAKEEFLDVLYPKARKHMRALESLKNRHRAWYASEFRNASKVWYKPGRGGLGTVDKMLAAFDKAHADYAAIWNSFDPKVKDFRSAVKALDEAFQELDKAVKDWQAHNETSTGKRSQAVDSLAEQMNKDAKSIQRVKEWIEDMAKRDMAKGYTAEWS